MLDTERRQWQRERELIEAQAAAIISSLKAEVIELRARALLQLSTREADCERR